MFGAPSLGHAITDSNDRARARGETSLLDACSGIEKEVASFFSGEGRDDASAARADPELGVATLEVVGGDVRGAELVTREAPHARASQYNNDTENEEEREP